MQNNEPLIGKTIAERYEIIELIGSGGQGSVYKAKQLSLNRIIALKILPSNFMEDEKTRARFHREAEYASRLDHENIVKAFEHGTCDNTNVAFIAMDYVQGIALKELIKSSKKESDPQKKLNVKRSIDIIIQVCAGMHHAHKERGILHRDIKPGNILLTNHNNNPFFVKITDFGIATVLRESDEWKRLTNTETANPQGTCLYMAPEQFGTGYTPAEPLDIYSIGCVLFELLTGEPPYKGISDAATIHMHITAKIPSLTLDPSDAEPVIKSRLAYIISKTLDKEPSLRYQTVSDLGNDLKKVQERLSQLQERKAKNLLLFLEDYWLSFVKQLRNLFVHLYLRRFSYSKATTFSALLVILLISLLFISSALGTFGSHYDLQYQPILHKAPPVLPSKEAPLFLLPPQDQLTLYIADADCERSAGDLRLALALYDKADLKADKIGNVHKAMTRIWFGKAICCLFADRPKLTVSSARYCFDDYAKSSDESQEIIVGITHAFCGQALYRLGNKKEAATEFKSFVTILEKHLQQNDLHASDDFAYACSFAGTYYAKEGDSDLANLLLERAGDYWKSIGLPGKYNLSLVHMNLAFMKIKINQYQEALDLLENAIADLNQSGEINIGLRNKLQLYIINLRLKQLLPIIPMFS